MTEPVKMYKIVDGVKSEMTPEEVAQFLLDIETDRETVGGSN